MYDYLSTYTSINNIYNTLTFIASIGVFVAPMPFSILFIELVISENLENHTAIEVQPIVQIENVTCNSEYIISYDFIPSIILE